MGPTHLTLRSVPGELRPERSFHHPPLSSAEFENRWSYTPSPLVILYTADRNYFIYFLKSVWRNLKVRDGITK
jgi:hypothetical protein